jgi:signal peptidase I
MKKFQKFIIYSLIILFLIYIVFQVIYKNDIVRVCGFSCLNVLTGSMSPEIEAGEKIIIKKCNDYTIGDIISYKDSNNDIITHRIIAKEEDYFITKGDYNNTDDEEHVVLSQIYGKVIYHFNSIFFNGVSTTFSKYVQSNTKNYFAKIANPVFIVEGNTEIYIDKYDTVNNYSFSIKNYNDKNISEVNLKYRIQIIADEQIEYKLLINDIFVVKENTEFILKKSIKTDRQYTLTINAPEDYTGEVKLNIVAYQASL